MKGEKKEERRIATRVFMYEQMTSAKLPMLTIWKEAFREARTSCWEWSTVVMCEVRSWSPSESA